MLVYYLVTALHVLVCVILILVVLLQSSKGADLAGAFGGSSTQTAFVNDFGANTGSFNGSITLQRYVPTGVVSSYHYIGSATGGTSMAP